MNWRNLKQAWHTADLILNGFLRQEHVEVTWWDPQRHSNVKRKYSYKGELTKIGTEWPELEEECGLFWKKLNETEVRFPKESDTCG